MRTSPDDEASKAHEGDRFFVLLRAFVSSWCGAAALISARLHLLSRSHGQGALNGQWLLLCITHDSGYQTCASHCLRRADCDSQCFRGPAHG